MISRRRQSTLEWVAALGGLGIIVGVYRQWLHINSTTVALTLLLYILLLAASLRLRHAVVVSVLATAAYNFYFLPPIGTFTIADPQNWLALFAFLATGVVGSRLSQKAKDETRAARRRQHEVEALLALSRDLLLIQSLGRLQNTVPGLVRDAASAEHVTLYLLDGDKVYHDGHASQESMARDDLRRLALSTAQVHTTGEGRTHVPLSVGVRPRGLLLLLGSQLSPESNQALGSLISIALDRAQALEDVARSEAERENERLRSLMLDSVTHELRTPLTAIKGASTTLLTSRQLLEDERDELASIIDEEADRLNRLVGRAVEMAQIESGEVHMHRERSSISALLHDAIENCAWVQDAHPLEERIPELPAISVDVEMMTKVFCNLLENAAKYSEPNAPIFISAERAGDRLLASVADRGHGIDESEQSLIFDRLYRSRSVGGRVAGSGMGLAISRAIVEAHQGKLSVTSQVGHGSVFTVSLPIE